MLSSVEHDFYLTWKPGLQVVFTSSASLYDEYLWLSHKMFTAGVIKQRENSVQFKFLPISTEYIALFPMAQDTYHSTLSVFMARMLGEILQFEHHFLL